MDTLHGWALAQRWARGGLEIIAVGVLVPIAVLIVGTPVAFAVGLLVALLGLS